MASTDGNTVLRAAQRYVRAGCSVIPVDPQSKKPTIRSWKPFMSALPTSEQIDAWSRSPFHGIGMIGGKVSGNIEFKDFDDINVFQSWFSSVEEECPLLLARLIIQKTPSGARHAVYRCPEFEIPGNLKLAEREIEVPTPEPLKVGRKVYKPFRRGSKFFVRLTLIETRGEGGYALVAPTPGYSVLQGDFDRIPVITPQERKILVRNAVALTEVVPNLVQGPKNRQRSGHGKLPGDDFNERGNVAELLQAHGWRLYRTVGNRAYFTRPGKESGISACLIDGKILYVFSSNAGPFEPGKAYAPFAVFTVLEAGGDYSAAAKILAANGYGERAKSGERTREDDVEDLCEFFRNKKPEFIDSKDRIVFFNGRALAPGKLWTVPGALSEVKNTPAYAASVDKSGTVKPLTEVSLARELCTAAGHRLAAELPKRNFTDEPDAAEKAKRAIVQYLIKPRSASTTVGLNLSLSTWATGLRSDRWVRFGSHPVFASNIPGDSLPSIAFSPTFLFYEVLLLRNSFESTSTLGRFLVKAGIVIEPSKPIRVEGRLARTWILAPEIIAEACGTPASDDEEGHDNG